MEHSIKVTGRSILRYGCVALFLLPFYLAPFACFAGADPEIESVQRDLKHAETYYWLARARGNSLLELQRSEEYVLKAQAALEKIAVTDDNRAELDALKSAAKSHSVQAEARRGIAEKYISNRLPLYKSLLGRMAFYESIDNPLEVASRSAIAELTRKFNSRISWRNPQPYLLILTEPQSQRIEEVGYAYLDEHTSYNVISPLELGRILGGDELIKLKQARAEEIPPEILSKIASFCKSNTLCFLALGGQDVADETIYYAIAHFSWWETTNKTFSQGYFSRGFSEDTRLKVMVAWLYMAAIALLCMAVPFLFARGTRTKRPSPDQFLLVGLSFLFSTVLVFLAFKALGKLSPPDDAYYSPACVWWIPTAGAVLSLLPLVASYFTSVRLNPDEGALRSRENVACLAFGAMASGPAVVACHAVLRFGTLYPLPHIFLWLVVTLVMAFTIAGSFESYQKFCHLSGPAPATGEIAELKKMRHARFARNQVIAAIIILVFFSASVLLWDLYILAASLLIALALLVAIHHVPKRRLALAVKRDPAEAEVSGDGEISVEWLSNKISKPEYIESAEGRTLANAADFILNMNCVSILHIEAGQGFGKSRMLQELLPKVTESDKRSVSFKGRCREHSGAAPVISYEPFALALGEHMGIGAFEDSRKKAEKIKQWLPGLEKVIGSVIGVPAICSLLNLEARKEEQSTNPSEIASAVFEFLREKSEKASVVFAIDDMQWMDDPTADLLESVFKRLLIERKQAPICFMLITRDKGDRRIKSLINRIRDIPGDHQNRIHRITEQELRNEHLPGTLFKALRFEHQSSSELTEYCQDCVEYRPLHILQLVRTLLQEQKIELAGREFRLKKGTDLSSVAPPDDLAGMLEKQICALDQKLVSVLETAALMGVVFRSDHLGDVYGMELACLLRMLREAERAGIVHGHRDYGLFVFDSTYIRNTLRDRLYYIDGEMQRLSQLGMEYLVRYSAAVEKELSARFGSLENAPYWDIVELAERTNAISDVIPGRCVDLNRIAGEKSYRSGRFTQGKRHFEIALSIMDGIAPDRVEKVKLLVSHSRHMLEAEAEPRLILDNINEVRRLMGDGCAVTPESEADLLLIESLALYRLGRDDTNFLRASAVCAEKVLNLQGASVCQRLRGEFYAAASISRTVPEDRMAAHLSLVEHLNEILASDTLNAEERREILKLESEALNNVGFISIRDLRDPDAAVNYFHQAMVIKCLPEIGDTRGCAISHGGLGDSYVELGQDELALKHYEQDLQISRQCGDLRGMMRMSLEIGWILNKKCDHAKAAASFRAAYSYAESAANSTGRMLALTGLIGVALEEDRPDARMEIAARIDQLESLKNAIPTCPGWAREIIISTLLTVRGREWTGMANLSGLIILFRDSPPSMT